MHLSFLEEREREIFRFPPLERGLKHVAERTLLSLSHIYAWKTSYEKGGGRFNSQGEEGDVFVIAGGEEREYHYFLMGSD